MTSLQDIISSQNGLFGGQRLSNSLGNTGMSTNNVISGHFNKITVHSASQLNGHTASNLVGITGSSLVAGDYYGLHTAIGLSGGDITVYKLPTPS